MGTRRFFEFIKTAGALGGGSVILAILCFAITYAEHAKDHNVSASVFGLLTIIFFCFGAYAAWDKERLAKELAETKLANPPRIIPKFPNPVSVSNIAWNVRTSSGEAQMITSVIRIRFLNDPQFPSPNGSVQDVIAKVTFTGGKTFDMDGRWTASDQPSIRPHGLSRNDLLRMSFGIGTEQDLDIAVKYPTGGCWALNNDSYNYPLMQKQGYELPNGRWKVEVRLRGTLVDESYTFYLESSPTHLLITQPDQDSTTKTLDTK